MQIKTKVLAYVVQNDSILIVEHVDYPECGLQIPGGTVEAGENLEEAIVREVKEETQLEQIKIRTFLGQQDYQKTDSVLHKRYFYLLDASDKTQDFWLHNELYPSEGTDEIIRFKLVWHPISEISNLAYSHDYYLSKVKELCSTVTHEFPLKTRI